MCILNTYDKKKLIIKYKCNNIYNLYLSNHNERLKLTLRLKFPL